MTARFNEAEAFAYVDNCLELPRRRAFEARLQSDPELRREIAVWETQNAAIRAAYGAAVSPRAPLDLGRNSNENLPIRAAASTQHWRAATALRNGEPRVWPIPPRQPAAAQSAAIEERTARRSFARVLLAIAVLAAAMVFVAPPGAPSWPRDNLISAALAAYRAFAAPTALTPVEFRASDPDTLTRWLAPQFPHAVAAPRLRSKTLTLVGGRIAPGTTASAAFLVYEDARGGRVGLLIEPLDAPSPSRPTVREVDGVTVAAWTDAGHGVVVIGAARASVLDLTRLIQTPAGRLDQRR